MTYIVKRFTIVKSPLAGFFNKRPTSNKSNAMKITEYIKDTRGEMAHVTWPSRKQAITYSSVVVLVSVFVSLFLGLFDYIFSRLLTLLV